MSTQVLKNSLHELIDQISDDTILEAVYTLLAKQKVAQTDFWERLTPLQRADIEAGIADLEAGRKKSINEVLKKYQ